MAAKKNDRFIIRFYSPVETIGGGVILDANPTKHKRHDEAIIKALEIKEKGDEMGLLGQTILEQSKTLTPIKDIILKLGMTEAEGVSCISAMIDEGMVVELLQGIVVHSEYLKGAVEKGKTILNEYHKANPISPGLLKEEYRRKLSDKLYIKDNKAIEAIIKHLSEKEILKDKENLISSFGFKVEYSPEQKLLRDILLKKYKDAAFEFPETDEIVGAQKDKTMTKHILEELIQSGELVKLSVQYIIAAQSWNKAFDILKKHIEANGKITLAEFRDELGTSRKYAVEILEAFDNKKITVKIEDARILNS